MSAVTIASHEYIDYTPTVVDIPVGTVLVLGELVCYAEQTIKLNTKGALRVSGQAELNADVPALTAGTIVYWDNTANQRLTTTAGANKRAGIVAADKPLNATRARILLGR